jgi:gluconate 2-dehydrogenase gamma chain
MGQGTKRSRRDFIVHTVLGFGGYLAVAEAGCKREEPPAPATGKGKKKRAEAPPAPPPEPRPGKGLQSLTATEYATLSAACERILPRDDDPGATDLGCADYIDRALSLPDVKELWGRPILGGLPILDRQAHTRHGHPFADCSAEQQDALLLGWQKSSHSGESAFFEVLHTLTLEGAFGDPTYGGNRKGLGFLMVGFVPPPPMPGLQLLDLQGR